MMIEGRRALGYERLPSRVHFFLDEGVYADAAEALLPEVAGYAAGMIDHLLRAGSPSPSRADSSREPGGPAGGKAEGSSCSSRRIWTASGRRWPCPAEPGADRSRRASCSRSRSPRERAGWRRCCAAPTRAVPWSRSAKPGSLRARRTAAARRRRGAPSKGSRRRGGSRPREAGQLLGVARRRQPRRPPSDSASAARRSSSASAGCRWRASASSRQRRRRAPVLAPPGSGPPRRGNGRPPGPAPPRGLWKDSAAARVRPGRAGCGPGRTRARGCRARARPPGRRPGWPAVQPVEPAQGQAQLVLSEGRAGVLADRALGLLQAVRTRHLAVGLEGLQLELPFAVVEDLLPGDRRLQPEGQVRAGEPALVGVRAQLEHPRCLAPSPGPPGARPGRPRRSGPRRARPPPSRSGRGARLAATRLPNGEPPTPSSSTASPKRSRPLNDPSSSA